MLRVPGRYEGARHTPEEQEDCVGGVEGQGLQPAKFYRPGKVLGFC